MTAHFILYVADQQRSKAFYEAVLGQPPRKHVPGMTEFELAPRNWGERVAYSLDLDGHVLAFAERADAAPASGFGLLKSGRAAVPADWDAASSAKR